MVLFSFFQYRVSGSDTHGWRGTQILPAANCLTFLNSQVVRTLKHPVTPTRVLTPDPPGEIFTT